MIATLRPDIAHDAPGSRAAGDGAGPREAYSIKETAERLGIGETTCYLAARRGEIPTIKIGRRLLVPRKAIERLLAGA